MNHTTTVAGSSARDELARSFVARWAATAGGELGNFQMYYIELADVLGLPRPQPSLGGGGDYVFEKRVTYADGRTGRADLFKAGCALVEAKCFGRAAFSVNTRKEGRTQCPYARRGSPAYNRAMLAAAKQGMHYARALSACGCALPFVIAMDIGYACDIYCDASGTGSCYAPYPDAQRILVKDLVRRDVRETLRLILSDPLALSYFRRHRGQRTLPRSRDGARVPRYSKMDHEGPGAP